MVWPYLLFYRLLLWLWNVDLFSCKGSFPFSHLRDCNDLCQFLHYGRSSRVHAFFRESDSILPTYWKFLSGRSLSPLLSHLFLRDDSQCDFLRLLQTTINRRALSAKRIGPPPSPSPSRGEGWEGGERYALCSLPDAIFRRGRSSALHSNPG